MATFEWVTLKLRRPASKGQNPEPAVETPATNGSDGRGNSVTLGPNDRLVGQLYIEGNLRVAGTVEGALEATGEIVINDGGRVSGPVTAYDRLVVGSAGSLNGDVRVSRLVVEDGATFSGNVSMGKQVKPAEPEPVAAEPAPVMATPPKPKKK
jgi:cytoskeletal protein CcmA (bactofilin family)